LPGAPMNILLFSMPDSFEHMPTIAVRMPNGALTSLAGNVDPHHRVAAADLLLVQNRVRETVERLVALDADDPARDSPIALLSKFPGVRRELRERNRLPGRQLD
jgi:hypothetical protein